jgi:hypothetical protein
MAPSVGLEPTPLGLEELGLFLLDDASSYCVLVATLKVPVVLRGPKCSECGKNGFGLASTTATRQPPTAPPSITLRRGCSNFCDSSEAMPLTMITTIDGSVDAVCEFRRD